MSVSIKLLVFLSVLASLISSLGAVNETRPVLAVGDKVTITCARVKQDSQPIKGYTFYPRIFHCHWNGWCGFSQHRTIIAEAGLVYGYRTVEPRFCPPVDRKEDCEDKRSRTEIEEVSLGEYEGLKITYTIAKSDTDYYGSYDDAISCDGADGIVWDGSSYVGNGDDFQFPPGFEAQRISFLYLVHPENINIEITDGATTTGIQLGYRLYVRCTYVHGYSGSWNKYKIGIRIGDGMLDVSQGYDSWPSYTHYTTTLTSVRAEARYHGQPVSCFIQASNDGRQVGSSKDSAPIIIIRSNAASVDHRIHKVIKLEHEVAGN